MTKSATATVRLSAHTLRDLAVQAKCDPRTIQAVLDGRSRKGMAYERAKAALVAAGYSVPYVEGK